MILSPNLKNSDNNIFNSEIYQKESENFLLSKIEVGQRVPFSITGSLPNRRVSPTFIDPVE